MTTDPNIRVEYVDFEEVKKWPRNPKDHDLREIKKSFDRFGFVQPVLIDENTGRLVAGHGRLETLAKARIVSDPPPRGIKVVDKKWLVPVLMGVSFTSEKEAEAFLLADNRLSQIGGWDRTALDEILLDMSTDDSLFEGTGFSMRDLPTLDDLGDIPEVGSKDTKEINQVCPKCGYEYYTRPKK